VDLNNFAPDNGQFITWSGIGDSGKNAYVYPLGIEYLVKVRESNSDVVDKTDTAEEENGPTVNLKRVDIKNFDVNTHPQHFSVATIIQSRDQTPSNAPKMLWGGFSQNHQGWVWKQGAETYDVFIGRESKTSANSAVRVNLQNEDNQYPDYRIELPSSKRYGFARVHKSGGDWTIDTDYQVNLERAPMQASISGPTTLDSGEEGTWTASVTGGSGSPSYDWEYRTPGGSTWYNKNCTGSSCSHTFYGDWEIGGIRTTVTKGSETDEATTYVTVRPNCDGRICVKSRQKVIAVRKPSLQAQGERSTALQWPAATFVVEHRADSTAAWSTIGTVSTSDSTRSDSTAGLTYRFATDDLEIGTHQFRVGLLQETGSAYHALGTGETRASRRYTEPVTATIEMEEAYRLSAYPNPVRERATVELAVKERQDVQVRLYDVLGRQIATLHDGPLPAQELRRLHLDVSSNGLTSGTYFLRATGEDFAATEQMTVVR